MSTPKETVWKMDPHTRAKHLILEKYLKAWFPILSSWCKKIIYLDGFCGPGLYNGGEKGSPIIALDTAIEHRARFPNQLVFFFIDGRQDRVEQLRAELALRTIPENFTVVAECASFDERMAEELDKLDEASKEMAPTFAFIDPFGFSGVPFDIVRRILKNERCEVFINFMVDSLNRWLTHPNEEVRNHIEVLFGTREVFQISNSPNRIHELRALYQRQLSTVAKYVRYFEMRNDRDRIQYYLFFAGNNATGFVKMKEAMWSVDKSGNFRFSDATDPEQMVLFENAAEVVWPLIRKQFSGKTATSQEIIKCIEEDPASAFLGKHVREALKIHEGDSCPPSDRISVMPIKDDGKPRRRGTFPPGAIVTFPG